MQGKFRKLMLCSVGILVALIYLIGYPSTTFNLPTKSFEETNQRNCDREDYREGLHGQQNDPCLIDIVRKKWLVPPSILPYNFNNKYARSESTDQKFKLVEEYVMDQNNPGFFIECGAFDGEGFSTTLRLETEKNWTGLLMEPVPEVFASLKSKNRKAWLINAAACPTKLAKQMEFFTPEGGFSSVGGFQKNDDHKSVVPSTVQCIPMYTILKAMNVTVVDYLSLDVEGAEMAVLQTIPFDEITFKLITAEYTLTPGNGSDVKEFLESKGYIFIGKLTDWANGDYAFLHQSLRTNTKLTTNYPELTWKKDEDNNIVEYVRKHHLFPPAARHTPYNFNANKSNYGIWDEYHNSIMRILKTCNLTRGFFVEAGALDGYYLSHSLDLEVFQGWTGLLVEASPSKIPLLKSKNRKAWVADVCITDSDNVTMEFVTRKVQNVDWMRGNGRINPFDKTVNASKTDYDEALYRTEGKVKCFRLPTLLKAISVHKVDLLVLDLQGHEFQILKTFPFEKIQIKVIAMEHIYVPEGVAQVRKFMEGLGYKEVYYSDMDMIFVLQ